MRTYRGCIYKETYHHKGRRSSGSSDGNACSLKRVRRVGMVVCTDGRWVAEITRFGKRYRVRSAHYDRVRRWLDDMCEKFNDRDWIPAKPHGKQQNSI